MNDELKNTLITELDLHDLDEQSQNAVISDVGETILRQILVDTVTSLPQETAEKCTSVLNEGDFEQAFQILDEVIPDFEAMVRTSSKKVIDALKED